jgi:hypothetical protein
MKDRVRSSLLIVCALSSGTLARAAAPAARVQLGETVLTHPIQVLRLGNIAAGTETHVVLAVRREPAGPELRVFCEGPFVACRWLDRSERTDRPSAGGDLEVRLAPASAKSTPHFLIVSDERGKPITLVNVDFQLFAENRLRTVLATPSLVSGLGKAWGPWYDVCSGPAPPGYALAGDDFSVEGPERGCGSWVNCERTHRDSSNVCWKFQIQGREAVFLKNPHETVKATGKLVVSWDLVASTPKLEPLEPTASGVPAAGAGGR